MATINGVTFNLKNLRIVSGHRNILTEQPGSDSNFINDMGYDGLTLRLEGYETSLSDYDSVVSEFMKQGGQILVHRTGWQFTVYSAQLMPGLLEGFDDTYFPYDLILYTSTPYRESSGQQARVKAITSNNEEWTAEDTGYSILHNWNFEDWNDGTSSAPDYYTLYGSGATINREASIVKKGTYSAQMNRSGNDCVLFQDLLYPKQYRGKTLTLGVWIYASVANRGVICIGDDAGSTYSDYHTGVAGWEFLTVTRTISDAATYVRIYPNVIYNGDTSVYCDSAILIEGSDDPDTTFSRDILTDGSVDALPDIQVIGGTCSSEAAVTQTSTDSNYNLSASGATVTITQDTYDKTEQIHTGGAEHGQTVNCRKAGMAIIDSIAFYADVVTYPGDITCTVYDGVGGSSLGSKTITVSTTGLKTFTFDTPIAVVQSEATCSDSTDANKIYFKLTPVGLADVDLRAQGSNVYTDGTYYYYDTPFVEDFYFVVTGHSCKEIRQTFQVTAESIVSSITLNMCKYQYAGTNPVTVALKESTTTLATATGVLSGSTFDTFEWSFDKTGAVILSTGTTYTLCITPPSDSGNTTNVLLKTNTTSVYASGAVTLIEDGDTERAQTHDIYFVLNRKIYTNTPQVYNALDSTVICDVANVILTGAMHRINTDGTGKVEFDDGFYTTKWQTTSARYSGCTHDTTNNELDIADDGYIYWYIDTKYPITGIPILNAQINNTAATLPTIQISTDASTWYDIDTVVVDDVLTEYPLDDNGNLSLKGRTAFYFRIDCAAAAVTQGCSVISFALGVDIITIDAEHPKVSTGSTASTFTCDQDSTSIMDCEIALLYRDRSWAV